MYSGEGILRRGVRRKKPVRKIEKRSERLEINLDVIYTRTRIVL